MLERERECGELPSPICPGLIPFAELNRDLLFSGIKGSSSSSSSSSSSNFDYEDEDNANKKAVAGSSNGFCLLISQTTGFCQGAR
jgi:hypothetical protein